MMTGERREMWEYTLWSRKDAHGPWEKEAVHRLERCEELREAGRKDAPDAEWLILPPGEVPTI